MKSKSPHTRATGRETVRRWLAPTGVECVAERIARGWKIAAGPGPLVGRIYLSMHAARSAVSSWGRAAK